MINAHIIEEPVSVLPEYALIPISFEVRSIFEVEAIDEGLQGFRLTERPVQKSWIKDYDAVANEGPTRWGRLWDISNWAILSAFAGDTRVGGCVMAYDTDGVYMLEGRKDVAFIWDLRVAPQHRGQGLGGQLIEAAVDWAQKRDCRMLKVETQNINVPACRLYAKQGFVLGSINRFAYPDLPGEVELIWCREL